MVSAAWIASYFALEQPISGAMYVFDNKRLIYLREYWAGFAAVHFRNQVGETERGSGMSAENGVITAKSAAR